MLLITLDIYFVKSVINNEFSSISLLASTLNNPNIKLDAATLKSKSSLLLARPNINPLKKSPLPAFANEGKALIFK